MPIQFEISTIFKASPEALYDAWLDSAQHSRMTGGAAEASADVGGQFSAWDGYITGRNLELTPGRRIVQTWRTSEFDAADPDSRLEILLEPHAEGAKLTLRHSNLPAHGMQYKEGWVDNYLAPMKLHFET